MKYILLECKLYYMNQLYSTSEIIEACDDILNRSQENSKIEGIIIKKENKHQHPLLLVNEISNDTISKTKNSFLNDLVTDDVNSRKNYEIDDKIKNEIIIKIYNLFKKQIKKNTLKLIVDQQIEIKKFQKKINYLNENKKALETSNHNLLSNLDKITEDKKMLIENNRKIQEDKKMLIENNRKIQEELSSQKSNFKKSNLLHNSNSGKLTELNNKLKFSQDENLRLSSEVFNSRKKYNVIKKQLYDFELQKNQLSNQIQELSDTANKSNLVTPSFINELPSEATEDIKKPIKKDVTKLNTSINKIFSKL